MKSTSLAIAFLLFITGAIGQVPCLDIAEPSDFLLCDDPTNDGVAQFDLSLKDAEILGDLDPALHTVSYYETQADADAQTNPLSSPYENTSQNQLLYVVVVNTNTSCSGQTTLRLTVLLTPSSVAPTPLVSCEENSDGIMEFDLESKTYEIINGEPWILVTYHETFEDAETDLNRLQSPYTNTTPFNQTVFARSTRFGTSCFVIFPLQLVVNDCSQNTGANSGNNTLSITSTVEIDFTLYPNPAKNIVHILGTYIRTVDILAKVYDISGKEVKSLGVLDRTKPIIDMSQLGSGVYFISLNTGNQRTLKKIIKI